MKIVIENRNSRLRPSSVLQNAVIVIMMISAMLYAVETHVMVSRSWPKLPIMCGIATLTTLTSMTERKVPSQHRRGDQPLTRLLPLGRRRYGTDVR